MASTRTKTLQTVKQIRRASIGFAYDLVGDLPELIMFNLIRAAVKIQTERLSEESDSCYTGSNKAGKIQDALSRLRESILIKMDINSNSDYVNGMELNISEIPRKTFSTIDEMLDFKISAWEPEIPPSIEGGLEYNGSRAGFKSKLSLRQALNLARNNIFGSNFGPLWGKSSALLVVEKQLSSEPEIEAKLNSKTPRN